jgi:hypothetical protein
MIYTTTMAMAQRPMKKIKKVARNSSDRSINPLSVKGISGSPVLGRINGR